MKEEADEEKEEEAEEDAEEDGEDDDGEDGDEEDADGEGIFRRLTPIHFAPSSIISPDFVY